jgi:hypothetical protein
MAATLFYFVFFLVLVPAIGILESELLKQYVNSSKVSNQTDTLETSKNVFKDSEDFVTLDRSEKR